MRAVRQLLTFRFCSALTVAMLAAAAALGAEHQSIQSATDNEWLAVTGKVSAVTADRFMLDYGRDIIEVEMDDNDWLRENPLEAGNRVTVSGRMDKGFFEDRKIEALSVHVHSTGAVYYANPGDEEAGLHSPLRTDDEVYDELKDGEWVQFTGAVASIDNHKMRLDAGAREFQVDTSALAYERFEPHTPRPIRVGDRVIVFGRMETGDLFDDRQIEASSITKLPAAASRRPADR